MSYLPEKMAYIKGLAEGLDIDASTKEGKLLLAIVDALSDTADEIYEIQDLQDEGVLNPKALFYIREYIDAKFDGNDFNSDGYFINKANKIDQFYAEGKAEVYAACTGYGELMERAKEADLRLRRAIVALDPKTVISTEDCKLVDDSEKFMNDYNQLTDKLNWEAK